MIRISFDDRVAAVIVGATEGGDLVDRRAAARREGVRRREAGEPTNPRAMGIDPRALGTDPRAGRQRSTPR